MDLGRDKTETHAHQDKKILTLVILSSISFINASEESRKNMLFTAKYWVLISFYLRDSSVVSDIKRPALSQNDIKVKKLSTIWMLHPYVDAYGQPQGLPL
ncbi:MAG: hypothetical protein MUO76_06170, partial [Anaerolineaceae bacterium]|nr:hypothetical protein [Anaerolineaceae bacterium]